MKGLNVKLKAQRNSLVKCTEELVFNKKYKYSENRFRIQNLTQVGLNKNIPFI